MSDASLPDISVVIRAHDPDRFDTLIRAVRSVHNQRNAGRIEIVLETSNFPDPLMLQDFVDEPSANVTLSHYNMPHAGDSRVDLMRHGVRAARAPVLSFLDFDDTLHPMGLGRLHASMTDQGAANIVIGNMDLVRTDTTGKTRRVQYHSARPSLVSLLRRNSVPIHSYMIRTDVARRAVARVPALTLFEDYAFLLAAMEEGHVSFLQPFRSVGNYNITDNPAEKYSDVSDFSWQVIERFTETLQVPISVSELKDTGQGATSQRALNAMIDALPEVKAAHVQGLVETVPIAPAVRRHSQGAVHTRPLIVSGWVCNTDAPDQILWGVYALTSRGDYIHISSRDDRPDVAAHLEVENGPYGFSDVIDTGEVVAVYAVIRNRKKQLPFFED